MTYAVGTRAWAVCDRCGFRVKYLELQTEWTNVRVCQDCYEEKHPQLDNKGKKADAEGLYQPSPDRREPLEVHVGRCFPPADGITHAVAVVGIVEIISAE